MKGIVKYRMVPSFLGTLTLGKNHSTQNNDPPGPCDNNLAKKQKKKTLHSMYMRADRTKYIECKESKRRRKNTSVTKQQDKTTPE